MNIVLTIDFGSTNTKVTAIDLDSLSIIARSVAYTTVETDVRDGLLIAQKDIASQCGIKTFDSQVACSSAYGGLKMISCGLVPDLTVKAGKMAASSAGAKVLKSFSYELSKTEQKEMENIKPDIILLCGGIDGGNKDVILHNAKMIAEIPHHLYVIVAVNKTVSDKVCNILTESGKISELCENVLPEFGKLNISPVKEAIREMFIKRIIEAKGLNEAQKVMSSPITPTPLAVFEASELLSRGFESENGFNDLLLYDVGGATTDVYSMCEGEPQSLVMLKGLKEPYAKRTVEGDIGVRYSLNFLMENIDFAKATPPEGVDMSLLNDWVYRCRKDTSTLPQTEIEKKCDMFLAHEAIKISIGRHVGTIEEAYSPMGKVYIQTGKDLSNVECIIGSGGSVINSINPKYVLSSSVVANGEEGLLKPKRDKINFMLDKENIMAACGLISRIDKLAAIKIMKKYLVKL